MHLLIPKSLTDPIIILNNVFATKILNNSWGVIESIHDLMYGRRSTGGIELLFSGRTM